MANYPVTRDGTKSGGQHIFTLAAVPEVRIAIESLGAVADVAWSTGRVDAYTVHADAGVRISVFCASTQLLAFRTAHSTTMGTLPPLASKNSDDVA